MTDTDTTPSASAAEVARLRAEVATLKQQYAALAGLPTVARELPSAEQDGRRSRHEQAMRDGAARAALLEQRGMRAAAARTYERKAKLLQEALDGGRPVTLRGLPADGAAALQRLRDLAEGEWLAVAELDKQLATP